MKSSCPSLTWSLEHIPFPFAYICTHTFCFSFFMLSPFFPGQSFVPIPFWLTWSAFEVSWSLSDYSNPAKPSEVFSRVDTRKDSWESTTQHAIIFLFVWSLISPADLVFSRTQLLFIPFCFYWNWLVEAKELFTNDLAKNNFGRSLKHGLNMDKQQRM